ncbi:MAG: hypothetical protein QOG20_4240 [Pseudonocardiales bacterium]|nr:hypothetical protein [Pseudonocardiales bacterium]
MTHICPLQVGGSPDDEQMGWDRVVRPGWAGLSSGTDLQGVSARRRLVTTTTLGLAVCAAAGVVEPWDVAALLGWDVAALALIGWVWIVISQFSADQTARHAVRDDPSVGWTDVVLLSASVASLAGVVIVFLRAGTSGAGLVGRVALGVGSVVLSWALVHTLFTLRYARLYYSGTAGGVDFNQQEPPAYLDFAYLAFTIGMTFQVSDTELQSSVIRHTAFRHALLSYLLGTVIIASTINLVAGLTK